MKEVRKRQRPDKHKKISAIMQQDNFDQHFSSGNDGRQNRELDCGHPSPERPEWPL